MLNSATNITSYFNKSNANRLIEYGNKFCQRPFANLHSNTYQMFYVIYVMYKVFEKSNCPLISIVRHIALGAEDLRFDSRAGQIGHSVANGSPPL